MSLKMMMRHTLSGMMRYNGLVDVWRSVHHVSMCSIMLMEYFCLLPEHCAPYDILGIQEKLINHLFVAILQLLPFES